MSLERAFEVDEVLLGETVSVLKGDTDPSIALVARPIGSLYLRTNGEVWSKTGTAANQWTRLEAGSATGGISESDHQALLQLIHFIDEGPANGFTSGATKSVTGTVFPTEELWSRQDGTALVRKTITWSNAVPTSIEWELYASDGTTVLATITDSISYTNNIFESSRTRAIA